MPPLIVLSLGSFLAAASAVLLLVWLQRRRRPEQLVEKLELTARRQEQKRDIILVPTQAEGLSEENHLAVLTKWRRRLGYGIFTFTALAVVRGVLCKG